MLVGLVAAIGVLAGAGAGTAAWMTFQTWRPAAHVMSPSILPRSDDRETTSATVVESAPARPREVVPLGRTSVHVPILEYHYIRAYSNRRDRMGERLSVSPSDFASQMSWLAGHDYHPVTAAHVRDYLQGREPLPARPVMLTFDDGYSDFFTAAFPILQEHHFTAVSYVVPGFIGQARYLTAAQVVELDRAGIEIGSHTVTHADLTRVSASQLQVELEASKGYLEQLLGHPVLDFCYPSGKFSAAVQSAVDRAGYQSATSQLPGTALGWADRFAWARVRVTGGETLAEFAQNLGPTDPTVMVTVAAPVAAVATRPRSPRDLP